MSTLLDDIKSVLFFTAFKPDHDNPNASWSKRFKGSKFLLLDISKNETKWAAFSKSGKLSKIGKISGDYAFIANQNAKQWANLSDNGWVGVSLNQRFMITLEKNLSRKEGYEKIIKIEPKSILGTKYDRSKRYALKHNHETSSSLLLASDDSMVKSLEKSFNQNGLKIGRVTCGLFSLLSNQLDEIYQKMNGADKQICLICCCNDSLAILNVKGNQWSDFRCRSSVFSGDISSATQMISPIIDRLPKGTPVYISGDDKKNPLQQGLVQELSSHGAKDITKPNILWQLLSKY